MRYKWLWATLAAALVAGWGYAAYELLIWRHESAVDRRVESHAGLIRRYADERDLPFGLVRAIVRAESGGDAGAVSAKGARGLMQIMPIAEREVRGRYDLPPGDLDDPEYNVAVGTAYLREMLDRFDGDAVLALAAYHAGPTRIARLRAAHPDLPPRELVRRHAPKSTAAYSREVLRHASP